MSIVRDPQERNRDVYKYQQTCGTIGQPIPPQVLGARSWEKALAVTRKAMSLDHAEDS